MLYDHRRPDVAVFIDFENVYVSVRDKLNANPNFETIMDRCNDLGRVVIARAYADWYRYPRITSALYANSIEPMYVPTYYYDKDMGRTGRAIKNSVDMNLCIDAMKTLYTNTTIGKFVLATGDRDFIPLVNSIRQQGKEVIVIGIGGAASEHLAQSADEFIFYEQLIGKTVTPNRRSKSTSSRDSSTPDEAAAAPKESAPETDIYSVLVDAIHLVRERGYVSTLGSIKLVMKELMGGDFKESRYRDINGRAFTKFKEFVMDAERRGKVQIFTSGTINEVFLPGEDPLKLSQFAGDLKEESTPNGTEQASVSTNGRQDGAEAAAPAEPAPEPTNNRSRRRRRPRRPSSRKAEQQAAEAAEQAEQPEPEQPEPAEAAEQAAEQTSEYEQTADTPPTDPEYEHILSGWLSDEHRPEHDDELFDRVLADVSREHEQAATGEFPSTEEETPAEEAPFVNAEEAQVLAEQAEPEQAEPEPEQAELPEPEQAEPEQAEPEPEQAEQPEPEQAEQPEPEQAEPPEITFNDEEWMVFRDMMSQFSKPVSFSQMVDTMKDMRRQERISRTNEQLRTMVKQAISHGMLDRSGRGARIYYTLKTDDSD
jgi:uncharacterized protein (TIGR00288 family)